MLKNMNHESNILKRLLIIAVDYDWNDIIMIITTIIIIIIIWKVLKFSKFEFNKTNNKRCF